MNTTAELTLAVAFGCMAFPQERQSTFVTFTEIKDIAIASGINNLAAIVGSDGIRGQLLINGTVTPISVPDSFQTIPYGIADNGRIVGSYDDIFARHGFLYHDGEITKLDFPDALGTVARAINNRQEIVGYFDDSATFLPQGFIYHHGQFTQFTVPGGSLGTFATAINDRGDIVGYFSIGDGSSHGFLFGADDTFTVLNVPFAGVTSTFLHGINNAGAIVGSYIDAAGQHGFVLIDEVFTTIDAPNTPPWIGTVVQAINDRNQILVVGATNCLGEVIR